MAAPCLLLQPVPCSQGLELQPQGCSLPALPLPLPATAAPICSALPPAPCCTPALRAGVEIVGAHPGHSGMSLPPSVT